MKLLLHVSLTRLGGKLELPYRVPKPGAWEPAEGMVRTDPDHDRLPVDNTRPRPGDVGAARIVVGAY